jgi:hypothetical protein
MHPSQHEHYGVTVVGHKIQCRCGHSIGDHTSDPTRDLTCIGDHGRCLCRLHRLKAAAKSAKPPLLSMGRAPKELEVAEKRCLASASQR